MAVPDGFVVMAVTSATTVQTITAMAAIATTAVTVDLVPVPVIVLAVVLGDDHVSNTVRVSTAVVVRTRPCPGRGLRRCRSDRIRESTAKSTAVDEEL